MPPRLSERFVQKRDRRLPPRPLSATAIVWELRPLAVGLQPAASDRHMGLARASARIVVALDMASSQEAGHD